MILRGVQFDDRHTATDWMLTLNSITIDPPEPKTEYVEVPGRDGDIDLTESLDGEIRYKNRTVSMHFIMTEGDVAARTALMDSIVNYLHGRQRRITVPDDQTHYMIGRCTVSGIEKNGAYSAFDVSCNCEPYRYAVLPAVRTIPAIETKKEYNLMNAGRKTLVPDLNVEGTVNIEFGTFKTSLSSGNFKLLDLKLKSGNNLITVSGSGTLTVTYREAVL